MADLHGNLAAFPSQGLARRSLLEMAVTQQLEPHCVPGYQIRCVSSMLICPRTSSNHNKY